MVDSTKERVKMKGPVINNICYQTGVDVTTWFERNGFNGYDESRVVSVSHNRKTGKDEKKTIKGKRYGSRKLTDIRQIMIHHTGGDGDGMGRMYQTLHNERGLSVHFGVDDDGSIVQLLDCKEKAWHGGKMNKTSIGIECALFPLVDQNPDYYSQKRNKRNNNLHHDIMYDVIHGRRYKVFRFTDPQVDSLAHLCASIWYAVGCELDNDSAVCLHERMLSPVFPRTSGGEIPRTVVENPREHVGLIGHLHVTERKIDPAGFPFEKFEKKVAEYFAQMIILGDVPRIPIEIARMD